MFNRANKTDKRNQKNKGFSLVELIVVIAIMAVLVAVLAPQFTKYVDKSRQSNDAATVSGIVTAAQVAIADTTNGIAVDTYTITVTNTDEGTKVTSATDGNAAALEDAIEAACGDLDELKCTATAWESGIVIEVTYNTNGTVTVTYEPDAFANYIQKTATEEDAE